jgi:fused signal recognition particle receptor
MPWTPELYFVIAAVALVLAIAIFFVLRRRSVARPVGASIAAHAVEPAGAVSKPPSLQESLTRTREGLLGRLRSAWGSDKQADARLAELEEVLLTADVGVKATQQLLAKLRPRAQELGDVEALRRVLGEHMRAVLADGTAPPAPARPHIILVAGVNGVGKTTTIGKLAYRYRAEGKKVLLVAADTFRAAASEQLERWAQRVGASCVRHQSGADPSAVAYDGVSAALARGIDVVIIDTAGRLHVKTNLMEELKKLVRVIGRQLPGAPHEVLLVIDATSGQNILNQARVFCEALSVTGVILTKLDGTAKGGAILAVRTEIGVPIRYVGLGEKPEDLEPFDADAFVDALLTPT